ncbi:MAG: TolC family protein [Thermodesulfobacteriota bacterium]|nr:TolC family protein [Thermodesulfobacteriota bacterium]
MKQLLLLAVLIMCIIFLGSFDHVIAEEEKETVFLNTLIDEALQNNPVLLMKKNQLRALEEKIPQVGTLPDPTIKLGLVNLPEAFDFNDEPMTQKQISLSQKLPFRGKLSLQKEIARKEVHQHEAAYTYQQLEIVARVKKAYCSLFFIDKSVEITKKNEVLLKDFLDIAKSWYSVGKGVHQDILKADVELSLIKEKLLKLSQQRVIMLATLNTLLNREQCAPLQGDPELSLTPSPLNIEAIQSTSLDHHPLLRHDQFLREKVAVALDLAHKEYYPDFEISVSYGHREDSFSQNRPDFFSGFVGLNIPVWYKTKQSRKVEELRYTAVSAQRSFEAVRNDLKMKITTLVAEVEQNSDLVDLYRNEIIPQARRTLDSSLTSYQVGGVDFLTLLMNLKILYRYELELYKVRTDYEKNLADLEVAVGKRLF